MAVESANKIHQLVPSAPVNAGPVSEGAGHLRVLKAAVQGSFTGFGADGDSGIVTLGADEINGLPASITTLTSGKQDKVEISLRNAATTLGTDYVNKVVYSDNATSYTYTVSDAIAVGDHIQVHNRGAGGITIAAGANTLHWMQGGGTDTGDRVLLEGGVATLVKIASGVFHVYGGGLS